MHAFLTGASGFVGTHLSRHLTESGDDVTGPLTDITEREAIIEAMAEAEPDVVYHLAAQADVGGSWDDPAGRWSLSSRSCARDSASSPSAAARRRPCRPCWLGAMYC